MICRECLRNKFDEKGFCVSCGTYSFEASDKVKNADYESKKKSGEI